MKLKIIAYVLKLKSSKELRDLCIKITSPENALTAPSEEYNAGLMESVRKIVPLEFSLTREVFKNISLFINTAIFISNYKFIVYSLNVLCDGYF